VAKKNARVAKFRAAVNATKAANRLRHGVSENKRLKSYDDLVDKYIDKADEYIADVKEVDSIREIDPPVDLLVPDNFATRDDQPFTTNPGLEQKHD
jgi:hypothetical protein